MYLVKQDYFVIAWYIVKHRIKLRSVDLVKCRIVFHGVVLS
jgi:hypothetical protein